MEEKKKEIKVKIKIKWKKEKKRKEKKHYLGRGDFDAIFFFIACIIRCNFWAV